MKKIFLSSSGGSGTSLSLFLECPLKYHFRYNKQFMKKTLPLCLWFGNTIHTALLEKHLLMGLGRDAVTDYLKQEITTRYANPTSGQFTYECDEEQDALIAKSLRMYDTFVQNTFRPTGIEEKMIVELENPETGEKDPSVIVSGQLDLQESVALSTSYDDNRLVLSKQDGPGDDKIIMDLKTSSMKLSSLSGHLFQLLFYSYLYYIKHKALPKAVGIYNLTKTKTPTFQQLLYPPTFKEIVQMYKMIAEGARKIRENKFEPDYTACRGRYFSDCEYLPICHPEYFDVVEIELEKSLVMETTDDCLVSVGASK
ncbi:MAG: PD-(D/E)XK nuclease family protein [Oligoflexia bacterium]|nr:PD-(D/E)XK nuclease family protein [Oligoflexia bacterium]